MGQAPVRAVSNRTADVGWIMPDPRRPMRQMCAFSGKVAWILQPVAQSLMCPAPRDGVLCEPGISRVCAGHNGAKRRPMNPSTSNLAI